MQSGLSAIEVGSCVSAKWVPQMADSDLLFANLPKNPNIQLSLLTPNVKGFESALAVGCTEVAIFTAASESFTQKNINCSIQESLAKFKDVIDMAKANHVKVRGYVSCIIDCPYEGAISPHKVLKVTQSLLDMGCYEVSLGETIGTATPNRVKQLLDVSKASLTTEQAISAGVVELLCRLEKNQHTHSPVWSTHPFWRLNQSSSYLVSLIYSDQTLQIHFNLHADGIWATLNHEKVHLQAKLLDQHTVQIKFANQKFNLSFNQTEQGITLFQKGQSYKFSYVETKFNQTDDENTENNLIAPMPGVITQVLVNSKDMVKKNDVLMTLEAMKIEYSIRAPYDGIVTNAYYQHGDQVKSGDKLIELQPMTENVA